jgi:hypothetical protein
VGYEKTARKVAVKCACRVVVMKLYKEKQVQMHQDVLAGGAAASLAS